VYDDRRPSDSVREPAGGGHREPVVEVRPDEVVGQDLALAADDAERHLDLPVRHVAPGGAGGAAGEGKVGVQPLVDVRVPGAGAGLCGDDHRRAADEPPDHPLRVQAVAAQVHHRATAERERPAGVAVRRGGDGDHRGDVLDPVELAGPRDLEQPRVTGWNR
jgi:hypothetical protein